MLLARLVGTALAMTVAGACSVTFACDKDTKATSAEVEKEIAEGRALDISGTPTIFVNGRRISQTIDWPNLKNIIDSEIEYQKTAKNAGDDCGCEVKLDVPGLPAKSPVIVPGKKK